jgi:hypothetical protein
MQFKRKKTGKKEAVQIAVKSVPEPEGRYLRLRMEEVIK